MQVQHLGTNYEDDREYFAEPSVTQNKTLNDRFLQKVVRKHRKTWREAERREVGSGDSGQDMLCVLCVKKIPKGIYLK